MIGFGISTHNRAKVSLECLKAVDRYTPEESLIVVGDDGSKDSTVPDILSWMTKESVAPGRICLLPHPVTRGIAKNKKMILDTLMSFGGMTDVLMIEDDVIPLLPTWYEAFLETARTHFEPHLLFMPGATKYGGTVNRSEHEKWPIAWKQYCSGLIMYFRTSLLKSVGTFHDQFGRYGWDHNELTARCLLTTWRNPAGPYPHCDAVERDGLVLSKDAEAVRLNQKEDSTVGGPSQQMKMARENQPIYDSLMRYYQRQYEDVMSRTPEENLAHRKLFFEEVSGEDRTKRWVS